MMWMTSFAPERVDRGGNRMEALGIRIVASVYLAASQAELTLTSTDLHIQPFLDFHLLEDVKDHHRMREAVRFAVDVFKYSDFNANVAERIEPLDSDLEQPAGARRFVFGPTWGVWNDWNPRCGRN